MTKLFKRFVEASVSIRALPGGKESWLALRRSTLLPTAESEGEEKTMSYHIGGPVEQASVETIEELFEGASGIEMLETGDHSGSTLYRVENGRVFFQRSEYLGAYNDDPPSEYDEGEVREVVEYVVANWPTAVYDTNFIAVFFKEDGMLKEVTLCQNR